MANNISTKSDERLLMLRPQSTTRLYYIRLVK